MHFNVLLYWNLVCSVTRKVCFVCSFICRKPAVSCTKIRDFKTYMGMLYFIFNIDWRCFWSHKTTGGQFQQVETDVDIVIRDIFQYLILMIIRELLIIIFIQNDEYNGRLKGIQLFEYKLLKPFQSTVVFVVLYENDIS